MDHKVSIKIDLNAYSQDFKYEWWVNFDSDETPREVAEWLVDHFNLAQTKSVLRQMEDSINEKETDQSEG